MELTDTIALVTGGASGLGKAVTELLAQKGVSVAILDKNVATSSTPWVRTDQGIAVACDVASNESVLTAFQTIKQNLGIPRICVNCAGIVAAQRTVGREGPMPLAQFEQIIDVNLIGTFNVLRIAAAEMLPLPLIGEERGVIINTASIAAYEGQIGQAAYSASKGGVASLTLPIARELASSHIRVMTIAPGLFETPMMAGLPEKAKASLLEATVFPKRLGRPEEFAQLVLHIIENPLLNGSVIRLDGAVRLAPK